MQFPVSGVEANPLLVFFAAFVVSAMCAPAGVSGAFLLLPFQVSVLGFSGPAVSPTNLIYNIFAAPGGIIRYLREGRVVWVLAAIVVGGSLPGVLVGALLRITIFAEPDAFKTFAGLVLLYLGGRLLLEVIREIRSGADEQPYASPNPAGRSVGAVKTSTRRIEYDFAGTTYAFAPAPVLLLAFGVGVIGGVYSIGGGAIIAPFLITVFGLPVRTVAGAAMIGTLVTSVAGVGFYEFLGFVGPEAVSPDWLLGATLGVGGLAGTYAGARVQNHLPERWIKLVLGVLVTSLAVSYVAG